ncbi:winged helix family two component transcriptional regulator [Paraburkholderia unamae]|jgi:DNA-binding response OmpR family regulator|uniref:response regulator n=1 Tax=Paraburkholderia unamae TaxID=219649 RepID=UPI000DC5AAF5|nr:response regulator [Paraburkholderia unamae]RAR61288.1 winged helix family two component transcriptional regulator [Paraburkholderia unamae]
MKLLLVEENVELGRWLCGLLREENFTVDWMADGEAADSLLKTQRYDLVIIEMHLPRMSGKTVLTRLRRRQDNIPVMMMTVHGSIEDKVDCFEAGADDYLVRPFDTRELLARIKALIRRQFADRSARLTCGDLHYRSDTREFRHNDTRLGLRRREHAILEALMLHQGRTVSKHTLMENIFGLDDEPSRDAIDIYIHRLRKHLAPSSAQILTLRGIGYILRARDAPLCEPTAEPTLQAAHER